MSEGNRKYLITGIVHGGGACAEYNLPGIFASVAHHLTFIQSFLPPRPTPAPTPATWPTPAPTPASCSSLKTNDRWAQKGMCPLKCGFKRAQKAKCHGACWKKCSPL